MDTPPNLRQQISALVAELIKYSDAVDRTEAELAQTERDIAAVEAELAATQTELGVVKEDLFAAEILSPEQFNLLHVTPDKFYFRQNLDQEFYTATRTLTGLMLGIEKAKPELLALKAKVAAAQARHDEMLSAIEATQAVIAVEPTPAEKETT